MDLLNLLVLKRVACKNFKGIKSLDLIIDIVTNIMGKNATCKTSIHDLVVWVLYGKDSKNRSNYEIKPLNKNGECDKNLETFGEVVLEYEGKTITFSRGYKEHYVQRKGEEEKVFKGHVTSFSINGVACSQSEFNKRVEEIIEEEKFKQLTNPMYFSSYKWDKRREVLVDISGGVSNKDVTLKYPELAHLLPLLDEYGMETLMKMEKLQLTKIKKKIEDSDIRIDECEMKIVNIDFEELRNIRADILNELNLLLKEDRGIMELKERELTQKIDSLTRRLHLCDYDISKGRERIITYQKEQYELREEWKAFSNKSFGGNDPVCPLCLRPFDEGVIEKELETRRNLVEEIKDKKLKEINDQGVFLKSKIDFYNDFVMENKEVSERISGELNVLLEERARLVSEIDKENDEKSIEEKASALRLELSEIDNTLMEEKRNESIKRRIEEISNELEINKKEKARIEKLIIQCEKFIKSKISMLEDKINSKFSMVKFKLFETLLNGTVVECCECTYNGVPFSALNSAAQVNSGLDIIKTLSTHYGIIPFVFIDGRESINEIIPLEGQVISLIVTNDEKLVVKGDEKKLLLNKEDKSLMF